MVPAAAAVSVSLVAPSFSQSIPQIDLFGDADGGLSPALETIKVHASTYLTGGFDTCFLASLSVSDQSFLVQVDTGSSDTILPRKGVNSYQGPYLESTTPSGQAQSVTNFYGDGSWWTGYIARLPIAVTDTAISGVAPVTLMTKQSTNPIFVDGVSAQGLIGVGFPSLAATKVEPATVMDAWFDQGAIQRNQIAIHGCPYLQMSESWIDFGNETPYSGCGGYSVTIGVPETSYFTLDLLSIGVNGAAAPKSANWQAGMKSIIDSCTSSILIPKTALGSLKNAIKTAGALSSRLQQSSYLDPFLSQELSLRLLDSDFYWPGLPTISFTIASQTSAFDNITLVLGPRQYIQSDQSGYWTFMISQGDDNYAILGLPLFSAYHIVLDRTEGSITFQPGCGCESSQDQYPLLLRDNVPPCLCPRNETSAGTGCSCSPHDTKLKPETTISHQVTQVASSARPSPPHLYLTICTIVASMLLAA
ncbi:hypothetical protein HDV03_002699 [Kappamyces sp. JEL0829]|nr:hypothetical protein HDV03_002699 [Kappamyces sp. JEL0829]